MSWDFVEKCDYTGVKTPKIKVIKSYSFSEEAIALTYPLLSETIVFHTTFNS